MASGRPFQPGDQVTYYVTGTKKNVRVFENAKSASQWDPDNPDENVEYYANKLEAVHKKFRPFVEAAGEGQLELNF